MCHQSDLECVLILHVAQNEEHLHKLRLHVHTMVFALIHFSGLYVLFQY